MIWKTQITPEIVNARNKNTMADYIGMQVTEVFDDYIVAKVMISPIVMQPIGIMNGGASCVLAESLGSSAANYAIDIKSQYCVGLSISTNHIRPAVSGILTIKASPEHIGKTTQIWTIKIFNESNKLISLTNLTMIVKNR